MVLIENFLIYLKDNEILISSIAGIIGITCSIITLFNNIAVLPKGSSNKESLLSFLPFISIFSKLSWRKAKYGAKMIAEQLAGTETNKAYSPSIIIGIGRGGAVFGALISYNLKNIPVAVLEREYIFENGVRRESPLFDLYIPKELLTRVLLVAGESHTGETMKCLSNYIKTLGAKEIRHAVFYMQKNHDLPVVIHYKARTGKTFNLMPWQEINSIRSSKCKEEADKQNGTLEQLHNNVHKAMSIQLELEHKKKDSFFYVIRHATTEENSNGDKFIGTTEALLNNKGKQQAIKTGKYLKERMKIDYIYTSPLVRCVESASLISSIAGGQIKIIDELKEMDYGSWENIKRADVIDNDYENYHNYISNANFIVPGSKESPEDVKNRIQYFIESVIKPQLEKGKNIVVVTHKTSGRILLMNLAPRFIGGYREIKMGNSSISKVNYNNGIFDIEFENHEGHLRWLIDDVK